jgi:hypothetical protein
MITKKVFEDDLIAGMQQELRKQASSEIPNLVKAAECLHAALEIFEEAGLEKQANQILSLLQKIAANPGKSKPVQKIFPLQKLMEAGVTRNDLIELSKGSKIAKGKVSLVMRSLGLPEEEIAKWVGHISEKDALDFINPNRAFSKIDNWIENRETLLPEEPEGEFLTFKSIAKKKDPKTKGLTPKRQVENLKDHGTQFNNAADGNFVFEVPSRKTSLTRDDMDADFADLLDANFDWNASDDDLMGVDINGDSLEVFDKDIPLADFEDERD